MEEEETPRERYDRLLDSGDYHTGSEKSYFNAASGGFVIVHREHEMQNFSSEFFTAKSYADRGRQVILQAEIGVSERVADADIDGASWEFKEITDKSSNVKNRLQDGMRAGRKQNASRVAFHVNRSDFDEQSAQNGVARGFYWDRKRQLDYIELIFNDGTYIRYKREDFGE